MRSVIVFGSVALIVLLDAFASARLLRSDVTSARQKLAWLALTWVMPLLGALLALQVVSERSIPAPRRYSAETGSGSGDPGISPSDGWGHGGHGADGGSGDASAHYRDS